MYLEKDYFLCEKKKDLKSDAEIVEFIKKAFPEVREFYIQDSSSMFVYSFFAYVCYPFGITSLCANLGDYFGYGKMRTKINKYVKGDILKTYDFKTRDMDCRKGYYVPSRRLDEISSHLPSFLKNSLKLRRSGGTVPGHDYGVGLSVLQLMLLEKPFTVEKEVTYAATLRKSRGSLCVDAVVHFYGDDFDIYLEQDMGTESYYELVSKLYLYRKHRLSGGRACVLFSSHEMMEYPKCLSFNRGALEKLYECMNEEEATSFSVFDNFYLDSVEEDVSNTFRAIAVRVGYYVAFKDKERVDASRLDETCEIVVNKNGNDFTLSEFRRYIDELFIGTNPYRQRMYNIEQVRSARHKFRGMCDHMCSYIYRNLFETKEVGAVINDGLSCLMYPTVLLSRSYSYINFDMKDFIVEVLKDYYEGIDAAAFSYLSPYIELKGDLPHCILRNCFTLADGSIVCAEHIGYDVGAFSRFYYLYLFCEYLEVPVHLVGLAENEDDVLFFSKVSGYSGNHVSVKRGSFFLSFLLLNSDEKRLCSVTNSAQYGYRLSYLSSNREIEAIRNSL